MQMNAPEKPSQSAKLSVTDNGNSEVGFQSGLNSRAGQSEVAASCLSLACPVNTPVTPSAKSTTSTAAATSVTSMTTSSTQSVQDSSTQKAAKFIDVDTQVGPLRLTVNTPTIHNLPTQAQRSPFSSPVSVVSPPISTTSLSLVAKTPFITVAPPIQSLPDPSNATRSMNSQPLAIHSVAEEKPPNAPQNSTSTQMSDVNTFQTDKMVADCQCLVATTTSSSTRPTPGARNMSPETFVKEYQKMKREYQRIEAMLKIKENERKHLIVMRGRMGTLIKKMEIKLKGLPSDFSKQLSSPIPEKFAENRPAQVTNSALSTELKTPQPAHIKQPFSQAISKTQDLKEAHVANKSTVPRHLIYDEKGSPQTRDKGKASLIQNDVPPNAHEKPLDSTSSGKITGNLVRSESTMDKVVIGDSPSAWKAISSKDNGKMIGLQEQVNHGNPAKNEPRNSYDGSLKNYQGPYLSEKPPERKPRCPVIDLTVEVSPNQNEPEGQPPVGSPQKIQAGKASCNMPSFEPVMVEQKVQDILQCVNAKKAMHDRRQRSAPDDKLPNPMGNHGLAPSPVSVNHPQSGNQGPPALVPISNNSLSHTFQLGNGSLSIHEAPQHVNTCFQPNQFGHMQRPPTIQHDMVPSVYKQSGMLPQPNPSDEKKRAGQDKPRPITPNEFYSAHQGKRPVNVGDQSRPVANRTPSQIPNSYVVPDQGYAPVSCNKPIDQARSACAASSPAVSQERSPAYYQTPGSQLAHSPCSNANLSTSFNSVHSPSYSRDPAVRNNFSTENVLQQSLQASSAQATSTATSFTIRDKSTRKRVAPRLIADKKPPPPPHPTGMLQQQMKPIPFFQSPSSNMPPAPRLQHSLQPQRPTKFAPEPRTQDFNFMPRTAEPMQRILHNAYQGPQPQIQGYNPGYQETFASVHPPVERGYRTQDPASVHPQRIVQPSPRNIVPQHQQMPARMPMAPPNMPSQKMMRPPGHHVSQGIRMPHFQTQMPNMMPAEGRNGPEPSVAYSPDRICVVCNQRAAFLCSGCKRMWYCSERCQSKSWQMSHRLECPAAAMNS